MTDVHETRYKCQIRNCPQPSTVTIKLGEWGEVWATLCDQHKPTVEQALRRGIVATIWKIHGYYPNEIAAQLSMMTGHKIRESTVRDDLRWMGLTEAHRAAEARLKLAVDLGEAGPNVVSLRRAR